MAHTDLASLDTNYNKYKVGKYFVNIPHIEDFIISILDSAGDVVLIDEIGKMELLSPEVEKAFKRIFANSKKSIISTIPERSGHPLIKRIRNSCGKDSIHLPLVTLTRESRGEDLVNDVFRKIIHHS